MNDDKFKKLIQRIDLDEPSAAFTDNIMKMVEAEEDLSLSPALLSVVKNELLAEPSFEFTDDLMAHIQPKASEVSDPIITKKVKLIISGVMAALLLVALVNSPYGLGHLQNSSYFSGLSLNLSGATAAITKMAISVLPYLIPVSVLLFVDYFFRTKRRQLIVRQ
jgi:hypothetical protein